MGRDSSRHFRAAGQEQKEAGGEGHDRQRDGGGQKQQSKGQSADRFARRAARETAPDLRGQKRRGAEPQKEKQKKQKRDSRAAGSRQQEPEDPPRGGDPAGAGERGNSQLPTAGQDGAVERGKMEVARGRQRVHPKPNGANRETEQLEELVARDFPPGDELAHAEQQRGGPQKDRTAVQGARQRGGQESAGGQPGHGPLHDHRRGALGGRGGRARH